MSYLVTSDVDLDAAHAFLSRSYWSPGVSKEVLARAFAHSICFSLRCDGAQVGFARVISDRATFAYLADVYVLEEHRGRGLARRLLEAVHAHPELQSLRRWLLLTRDAHGLYRKLDWADAAPGRLMERK
ncbi:MAG TPA: GNAT family N-acetyltransferase [Myxococcales bacterium]|nr:GNAT family N-acetyltransferase [Myxococcales bacterium]